MTIRTRIANHLRNTADRLDHHGAPKYTGWSFTFETGHGIRFRTDNRGCPVTYYGDTDYARAHTESDSANT